MNLTTDLVMAMETVTILVLAKTLVVVMVMQTAQALDMIPVVGTTRRPEKDDVS